MLTPIRRFFAWLTRPRCVTCGEDGTVTALVQKPGTGHVCRHCLGYHS